MLFNSARQKRANRNIFQLAHLLRTSSILSLMKLPHGYSLQHFDEVDCIMAQAKRLAEAGAEEGTLLVADRQFDGKGRFGKTWHSTPGSVHVALILRPEFSATRSLELVHVAMLALGTAVSEQVSPMTELHYRWPNTLLISRGKAAGMFVEMQRNADAPDFASWMNIGFAVNMNSYPRGAALEAAALSGDGDCTPERGRLVESFSRHFLAGINRWAEEGLSPFRRHWVSRADGMGSPATITLATETLKGTPRDLAEDGSLMLENVTGEYQRVALADYFSL